MDNILDKVDFDAYDLYDIQLSVRDSFMFENDSENISIIEGQDNDVVSHVRRAIKNSSPFENKKIIQSINVSEEQEDEDGVLCRNIDSQYYILVPKEEVVDFCTDTLHDDLEEEWSGESSSCEIKISPKERD